MSEKKQHIIKRKPFFLILLPVFFVLHGYLENFNYVPVKDALLLIGIYLVASLLFTLLFYWLYRSFTKAALAAFLIMAFHFFFGVVHDGIKNLSPGTFITKYSFVLTLSAVLFLTAFIFIKKRKKKFTKTSFYLNTLFLILITIDAILLVSKIIRHKRPPVDLPKEFTICATCPKPDIHFVILDEYTGYEGLRDNFQFDNSSFLNQLASRGFHTLNNGQSNYNQTPYSIASILNMEYLQLSSQTVVSTDLGYCYEKIRHNKLKLFLESNGYEFYNNSIFDFDGQPTVALDNFLPSKTKLITSQTFLSRFDRDLRFNFVTRLKLKRGIRLVMYSQDKNNRKLINSTLRIAERDTKTPKFTYTHLIMPHYPYYYDSSGNERPFETLLEGNWGDPKAYIEYLQYSNRKIIEFVDNILKNSKQQAVIILMGDHGFRYFNGPIDQKYYFSTLNSIYLPSRKYDKFKDSSSAVNFFRTLLNSEFQQQLPYLKDSTVFVNK